MAGAKNLKKMNPEITEYLTSLLSGNKRNPYFQSEKCYMSHKIKLDKMTFNGTSRTK
jgi:hypothetical protein